MALAAGELACAGVPDRLDVPPGEYARFPSELAQASSEQSGVALRATAEAWPEGDGVLDAFTPFFVELENRRGEVLEVAPRHFELTTTETERYVAWPPDVAARWSRRPEAVRDRALDASIVEPGERRSGFIYFERIEPDETPLRLELHLMTSNGENVGEVALPFVIGE